MTKETEEKNSGETEKPIMEEIPFHALFSSEKDRCDTFQTLLPFFIYISDMIEEDRVYECIDESFPMLCNGKEIVLSGSIIAVFLEDIDRIFESEDMNIRDFYRIIESSVSGNLLNP